MPLRIVAHREHADGSFSLAATGALTLQTRGGGPTIDGLFPWLSIRTIHDPIWSFGNDQHAIDLPLKPLDEDERLVGYVGADPDVLAKTFPGKSLIRVALDATDPLPGDISAWEALDGLVLDSAAASRIGQGTIRSLLAGGTAIAIKSRRQPGGGWPWIESGAYWITRIPIAGPTSSYAPDAYLPTRGWTRGWPDAVRHRVLGGSILFSILLIGFTLWPSRWRIAPAAVLCIVATVFAARCLVKQDATIHLSGSIAVLSAATTQQDRWTYFSVLKPAELTRPCVQETRLVFGDRQQAESMNARQIFSSDGGPQTFEMTMTPRQTIAMQTRTLSPEIALIPSTVRSRTAFAALADGLYVGGDDRLLGRASDDSDEEMVVVVKRR